MPGKRNVLQRKRLPSWAFKQPLHSQGGKKWQVLEIDLTKSLSKFQGYLHRWTCLSGRAITVIFWLLYHVFPSPLLRLNFHTTVFVSIPYLFNNSQSRALRSNLHLQKKGILSAKRKCFKLFRIFVKSGKCWYLPGFLEKLSK